MKTATLKGYNLVRNYFNISKIKYVIKDFKEISNIVKNNRLLEELVDIENKVYVRDLYGKN